MSQAFGFAKGSWRLSKSTVLPMMEKSATIDLHGHFVEKVSPCVSHSPAVVQSP